MKTWKRRWFILTDSCLYYFEFTTVSLAPPPPRPSPPPLAPSGLPLSSRLTELGDPLRSRAPPPHPFYRWGKLSYGEAEGPGQGIKVWSPNSQSQLFPRCSPSPPPGLDRIWKDGCAPLGFGAPHLFTPCPLPQGSICRS